MGKNYFKELGRLQETYDWARNCDLDALAGALSDCQDLPLIAVGSGGSLSAAAFAAMLHEEFAGCPAKHATPLELAQPQTLGRRAVLLISARGNNPDIIQAVHLVGRQEPPAAFVLLLSSISKAARVAEEYPSVRVLQFEPPVKRDGYLATNSIVAVATLLICAYERVFNVESNPPPELPKARLESKSVVARETRSRLRTGSVLSILYGGWGMPSAIDLESKMTEAAIGYAQVSDYRNFAHGRHYWIARRSEDAETLALISPETAKLAERTSALLPDSLPSHQLVATRQGPWGGLELLVGAMDFIADAAANQGIDPGRPSVPDFGRRIYRLSRGASQTRSTLDLVVRRKLGYPLDRWGRQVHEAAHRQLQSFLSRLAAATFDSLLFDYDGTLCAEEYRRQPLPEEVVTSLRMVLEQGIGVGIATGRGRSVRDALQRSIPSDLWPRVVIGYYNGAEVSHLDEPPPDRESPPVQPLADLAGLIDQHPTLALTCRLEQRQYQLTISPTLPTSVRTLHRLVLELVNSHELPVSVVRSSSSVDVTAAGVTKLAVLTSLREGRSDRQTLAIADGGSWHGNDLALLSTPFSLTVQDSPRAAATGWNLAPPGYRGVAATLFFLESFLVGENEFHVDLEKLLEWTSERKTG